MLPLRGCIWIFWLPGITKKSRKKKWELGCAVVNYKRTKRRDAYKVRTEFSRLAFSRQGHEWPGLDYNLYTTLGVPIRLQNVSSYPSRRRATDTLLIPIQLPQFHRGQFLSLSLFIDSYPRPDAVKRTQLLIISASFEGCLFLPVGQWATWMEDGNKKFLMTRGDGVG